MSDKKVFYYRCGLEAESLDHEISEQGHCLATEAVPPSCHKALVGEPRQPAQVDCCLILFAVVSWNLPHGPLHGQLRYNQCKEQMAVCYKELSPQTCPLWLALEDRIIAAMEKMGHEFSTVSQVRDRRLGSICAIGLHSKPWVASAVWQGSEQFLLL